MSRKPKQSSLVINYSETKIHKLPGMIEVVSINPHGFRVVTEHFYERDAALEREKRARQGHVVDGLQVN